jgi:peptidyl-prolyl cis-trans isomerase C
MRKFLPMIFLLTLSLLALALAGCGSGDGEKSPQLAVVNDNPITKAEFAAYLKFKRAPADDQKRRRMLLDQYLEREALAAAIEKAQLLDQELIAAELNEFRKEMLISRYFEKFLKDKVTEQAVQNYYNTHAADYEQRMAHGAHILIRTNKAMGETERKVKLTTAQEAYSKIRAGQDFGEIAKDYSEDKVSAKKGGDLGWLKEGSFDARFSKTLFGLDPAAVSEPFETPFGFHVVKLIEGPKVVKRPLSAVAGDIRYQLRAKAKKAELERLVAEVKVEKKE